MTMPKSLAAYTDCEEFFEKAATSPNGLGVTLESPGMAVKFRQKMNAYRVLLRKQSKTLFEPDDPKFGLSPYDAYELSIDRDNNCRVLVRKYRVSVSKVEQLE